MPTTYEPIATTTLSTASNSVTFSSISGSYTDLRITFVGKGTGTANVNLTLNDDSATNYSLTRIFADGTTVSRSGNTNIDTFGLNENYNLTTAQPQFFTAEIFNYAGNTNKQILTTCNQDENGAGQVGFFSGLYRSTSAITSVKLNSGSNFAIGTTITLYGILKA